MASIPKEDWDRVFGGKTYNANSPDYFGNEIECPVFREGSKEQPGLPVAHQPKT